MNTGPFLSTASTRNLQSFYFSAPEQIRGSLKFTQSPQSSGFGRSVSLLPDSLKKELIQPALSDSQRSVLDTDHDSTDSGHVFQSSLLSKIIFSIKMCFIGLTAIPVGLLGGIAGVLRAFTSTVYERYIHYRDRHASKGAQERWDIYHLQKKFRKDEQMNWENMSVQLSAQAKLSKSARISPDLIMPEKSSPVVPLQPSHDIEQPSASQAMPASDLQPTIPEVTTVQEESQDPQPREEEPFFAALTALSGMTNAACLIDGACTSDQLFRPSRYTVIYPAKAKLWRYYQLDQEWVRLRKLKTGLVKLKQLTDRQFELVRVQMTALQSEPATAGRYAKCFMTLSTRAQNVLMRSQIFCSDCCPLSNSRLAHALPPVARALLFPLHPAWFVSLLFVGFGMGIVRTLNMWRTLILYDKETVTNSIPNRFPVSSSHLFPFGRGDRVHNILPTCSPSARGKNYTETEQKLQDIERSLRDLGIEELSEE